MNAARLIWAAHLRAAQNSWQQDPQTRFAGIGTAVVLGLAGVWLAGRLMHWLSAWQELGQAAAGARLWFLVLVISTVAAVLTALGTLQVGFDADESTLLLTLPIPPAVRFRTLYGVVLVERLGHLLLFQLLVVSVAATAVLKLQALVWLAVLVAGVGVAAWIGMVGLFAIIHLALARPRLLRLAAGCAILAAALLVAAVYAGWLTPRAGETASLPAPTGVAPVLLAAWGLLLGFGARPGGRLYVQTCLVLQGHARPRSAAGLPGARLVGQLLSRFRGLTGAFFYKGWISQSRNPLLLFRLTALALSVLIFPRVRVALAPYGLDGWVLLVGYCLLVTQVALNEMTVNAIAGEGNRMILYLAAPVRPEQYLRAKYWLFALPVGGAALLLALLLNWQARLAPADLAAALPAVALVVGGNIGILVWGSAWDEDLSAAVEGPLQAFLQEEAPITPRRLLVLGLGVIFQVLAVGILLALPWPWSLPALAVWCLLALSAAWRLGQAQWRRLVRGG